MTQEERWILEKYNGEKTEGFLADIARLQNGEPLAYILGSIPFLNTTIYLDSHPLIPRAETEYWVDIIAKQTAAKNGSTLKILDLCSGSGCIGISLAKALPLSSVDFAELDISHHKTIQKNIQVNSVEIERTRVFGGDLFENTPFLYDLICANPPYIADHSPDVEKSVTDHEPHLALYGGAFGLDIIFRIIAVAPQHLFPSGTLVIEHDPQQSEAIARYAEGFNMKTNTHNDQYKVPRYSILTVAQ